MPSLDRLFAGARIRSMTKQRFIDKIGLRVMLKSVGCPVIRIGQLDFLWKDRGWAGIET